jgi:protein-tyrosine-phosphatase
LITAQKGEKMASKPIIFVCEHGAAKSVIAAAYFNKMAQEMGADQWALARGTNPDEELSQVALAGLHADGLTPTEVKPQKLLPDEIEAAQRIVVFCELPEEYPKKAGTESWDDVPPVSENYEMSRNAILAHLRKMMNNL